MEKNTKLITGLMIAILAASALAIAPMIFAEAMDPESLEVPNQIEGTRHRRNVRHPLLRFILKNGEYAQLTGNVVAQKGPVLVLSTESSTVYILVPPHWVVESEILNKTEMFDGSPFAIGSTITVDTLKANYIKDTYEITAYFAFKISGDDIEAKALLPFNLEAVEG
jgi:hypothetical protein